MSDTSVRFDAALVRKYDVPGPRYTSYPTAPQFSDDFDEQVYRAVVADSNGDPCPAPLSLYVHLPFCATVCYYCACTKVITANRSRAEPYLERLFLEIQRQGALFDHDRKVDQLHLGGGSPTFLNGAQLGNLLATLRKAFNFAERDAELSIEVDPRTVGEDAVARLGRLGFNRMSLGVQDFDPAVQQAVNRVQSEVQIRTVIDAARRHGFESLSFDLIYGLPFQSVASFERTLETVIGLGPDRISVFNYAHLPHLFKVQKQIDPRTLPTPEHKLAILGTTIARLTEAGYVYLGMDHFARPDDELASAQRRGVMTRNFQGYSTRGECDVVGLGMSAIGKVGGAYAQNARGLEDYLAGIDAGGLAVRRGLVPTPEDRLRRDVIQALACDGRVEFKRVGMRHRIDFAEHFADELQRLEVMAQDGLVAIGPQTIEILPAGRLLLRNVCMVFDAYLGGGPPQGRYSRAI